MARARLQRQRQAPFPCASGGRCAKTKALMPDSRVATSHGASNLALGQRMEGFGIVENCSSTKRLCKTQFRKQHRRRAAPSSPPPGALIPGLTWTCLFLQSGPSLDFSFLPPSVPSTHNPRELETGTPDSSPRTAGGPQAGRKTTFGLTQGQKTATKTWRGRVLGILLLGRVQGNSG